MVTVDSGGGGNSMLRVIGTSIRLLRLVRLVVVKFRSDVVLK